MKIYCEIDFHIFPIMKTIRVSLYLYLLCWKYLIISMQMKLFWLATADNGCLL